jgi:hypothetical protein
MPLAWVETLARLRASAARGFLSGVLCYPCEPQSFYAEKADLLPMPVVIIRGVRTLFGQ